MPAAATTAAATASDQSAEPDVQSAAEEPRAGARVDRRPEPESVEQLFSILQGLVADERARGQALESKSSTLAGFTGAILAITAGVDRALFRGELGAVGTPLFRALVIVSIVALATASALAVLGVLRPQGRLALARAEIKRFCEFPLIATPRMEIQGRMMSTLAAALEEERRLNDRRARLGQFSSAALAIGLVAVAGQALIFAVTA